MTAHFHGTLADHYQGLLETATNQVQRSIARASFKYHHNQYRKLNDHFSHKTVLPPVQGNYVRRMQEEPFLVSS